MAWVRGHEQQCCIAIPVDGEWNHAETVTPAVLTPLLMPSVLHLRKSWRRDPRSRD